MVTAAHIADVSARKCGAGTFGKAAAEEWRDLMQFADGPKAFAAGVEIMLENHVHSKCHCEVIRALAREHDRTHYTRPDL